ncbi:MAG: transglycosylase domain-containing protein [Chitinophagaceae bacterium]
MHKTVKFFWRLFFGGLLSFIIFLLLCNWGVFGKMPSIDDIQNPTASLSSQVYAQDGSMMGKYFLQDRVNVEYKDISPNVINALVATEDERFYEHSGIDLRSLGRAAKGLGTAGGASTITMQTAKNLFTENWGTKNYILRVIQKFKECIIAVKLEKNFTKEEILALYLNTVEYSDHVFGIRNAAKTFYQKEPDRLNVQEAAMLVGMVNGPGLYNPRTKPKNALERRNLVLDQMKRNKFLTDAQSDSLKLIPNDLSSYKKLDETTGIGPYFRSVLAEELKEWCDNHEKPNGEKYNLYKDGLKIYTTINPKMQIYAEEAVAKHLSVMQKLLNQQSNIKDGSIWKGYENVIEAGIKQSGRWRACKDADMSDEDARKTFNQKVPMKVFAWNSKREKDTIMSPVDSVKYCRQMMQAGFMAMDPISGEVRAWVGGIDFKTFKYDHVNANTGRQVGSTIKPLLYGLAIEQSGLTPSSIVQDVQQNFSGYGLVPATSRTCSGGSMTMERALTLSKNCATAYIMKQLDNTGNNGAKMFVDFLNNKCGLQKEIKPNPSIALGACEISLYELMHAYTMLPGKGFNVKPIFITRIEDRNGNPLEVFSPVRKEVISEVTSYHVVSMMKNVVEHGTARNLKLSFSINGEVAGKTGTTNDNTDAWFVGYTPQLLAGSWVGCDNQFIRFPKASLDGQGARAAMPIWAYFYEKVLADPSIAGIDPSMTFTRPESMSNEPIYGNEWNNIPSNAVPIEDEMNGGAGYYYGTEEKPTDEIKAESKIDEGVNENKVDIPAALPPTKQSNPLPSKPKDAATPTKSQPANKPKNDKPKVNKPKQNEVDYGY